MFINGRQCDNHCSRRHRRHHPEEQTIKNLCASCFQLPLGSSAAGVRRVGYGLEVGRSVRTADGAGVCYVGTSAAWRETILSCCPPIQCVTKTACRSLYTVSQKTAPITRQGWTNFNNYWQTASAHFTLRNFQLNYNCLFNFCLSVHVYLLCGPPP